MAKLSAKMLMRAGIDSATWRQAVAYCVIGGTQLTADWLCFVILSKLGLAVVPANLSARIGGAVLGFWLNGRYTFSQPDARSSLGRRQLVRFAISWSIVSICSTVAVSALAQYEGLWLAWLGKPIVDAVLALFGFLASKYWIYR